MRGEWPSATRPIRAELVRWIKFHETRPFDPATLGGVAIDGSVGPMPM